MKVNVWLQKATKSLQTSDNDTARLDALILLEDATHMDRSVLLAHPERELSDPQIKTLEMQLRRRKLHEPLAYIRGKSAFYGRTFTVNRSVLVPRPESETIIDLLKSLPLPQDQQLTIADVGTGSGCLGITAALELPQSQVHLFDVDKDALIIAQQNMQQFNLELPCHQSHLLKNTLDSSYDVILANLPYVPEYFPINPAARQEPHIALYGGKDGLELYRNLFAQITKLPHPPQYVITESLLQQHSSLEKIANLSRFQLHTTEHLIQVFSYI